MNGLTDMNKVTSRDGTIIAYETVGSGPAVVLIGGAFCDRNFAAGLAGLLSNDFTAVSYDRRGRGGSGDTRPYAIEREIEDLQAVIGVVGGSAFAYGVSSGAILALHAAAAGAPLRGLALVEPPFRIGDAHNPGNLANDYTRLCDAGQPGEAVALFMTKAVGGPPEQVEQARQTPMWPALEAMAPTLAYDATICGDGLIPVDTLAKVSMPVLMIDSTASTPWLRDATKAAADTLPDSQHVSLPGQFHQPDPEATAAEMRRFFGS